MTLSACVWFCCIIIHLLQKKSYVFCLQNRTINSGRRYLSAQVRRPGIRGLQLNAGSERTTCDNPNNLASLQTLGLETENYLLSSCDWTRDPPLSAGMFGPGNLWFLVAKLARFCRSHLTENQVYFAEKRNITQLATRQCFICKWVVETVSSVSLPSPDKGRVTA